MEQNYQLDPEVYDPGPTSYITDQNQKLPESNAVRIETILRKLSQHSCAHATPLLDSTAQMGSPSAEDSTLPKAKFAESSSTSVSEIIKCVQKQVALLATLTRSAPAQQKEEKCTACEDRARHTDELYLQIDTLRHGWMEDKTRHVQVSLDLQQMHHVVDCCNVTFQQLRRSKDGLLGNGLPLSQIAVETISSYCDEQRKQHWDETRTTMDRKSSKMKKKARDMLKSNQIFHKVALSFNIELYHYSQWLDMRCRSLQDNYRRYCQIMQERGAKPELLYDDHEVLLESQTAYTEAFSARLQVARKATEAAQLHGLSDPFGSVDEV